MNVKDVILCYVAAVLTCLAQEVASQGGMGGCDQEVCQKANSNSYPLPVECAGGCLFVCAIGNYFYNVNEDKVCHMYSGKTSRFPTSYGVCSNGRCGNGGNAVESRSGNSTNSQREIIKTVISSRQSDGDDGNGTEGDPVTVCAGLDPKAKPYNLFCEGTCSFTCIIGEPHFRENGKECERNNDIPAGEDIKPVGGTCYHGVCLTEDEKQYC